MSSYSLDADIVKTAEQQGWSTLPNGQLLKVAEGAGPTSSDTLYRCRNAAPTSDGVAATRQSAHAAMESE